MSTSTTSPARPPGRRTLPAGRVLGGVDRRGGHRPASSVIGAARWAAVVLLATGVVFMHAVLSLAPMSSASSTSSAVPASLANSHASTPAAPGALAEAITQTTGQATGSPSMSTSGTSSGAVSAQVPPDTVEVSQGDSPGHGCVHCQGADHAMSLGHLCLAIAGGLLLAGAAVWGRRRHRLPVLDLDVRRSEQRRHPPARAVLGVPPWSHLSLTQLSLLRV